MKTEDFVSLLIDKSKIQINDTSIFIENKIKDTFDKIQTELLDKIKSDVQNELIKKFNNENIEDIENTKYVIKKTDVINSYLPYLKFKNDEYLIFYCEFNYCFWSHQQQIDKKFIAYTNYNNVFAPSYSSYRDLSHYSHNDLRDSKNSFYIRHNGKTEEIKRSLSNLKIPYSFLNFIKLFLSETYKLIPINFHHESGSSHDIYFRYSKTMNDYSKNVLDLTFSFSKLLYDVIEKYYTNKTYGMYGNKFEEIVKEFSDTKTKLEKREEELKISQDKIKEITENNNLLQKEAEDYSSTKAELEKCKEELKISQEKIKELSENNTILQKELDDCSYLKKCLLMLNNK
jgi:hypothetical protein